MKKGRRVARARSYYDPGKNPKPRPISGDSSSASVAKETRQLRRQREREAKK